MITYENGKYKYFDKNGTEITKDSKIRYPNGRIETVYLAEEGVLGTDATNKSWIKSGRACPCEYGIYCLGNMETDEVEVVA